MIITHTIKLDLDCCGDISRIDVAQGDANTRQICLELRAGGGDWTVPDGVQPLVRFRRPDGGSGAYDTLPDGSAACAVSGNVITAALMSQMFTAAGIVTADICLVRDTAVLSTFPFQIDVHPGAGSWLAPDGVYRNVSGFVPMPEPAAEGQFIRVTEVDEYGIVQATETTELDTAPVRVPENEYYDMTGMEQSAFRYGFHMGNTICLGDHAFCRINKLAVLAVPGSEIRFALFGVQRNEDNTGTLTQLAVLGEATADPGTGLAVLEPDGGYTVDRDDTAILALAAEPVIACYEAGSGMTVVDGIWFDDADYSEAEDGAVIPCIFTTGLSSDPKTACSLFIRDIDYVSNQTLGQYIRETGIRLQNAGGGACGLPMVSGLDNGKLLRVVNGVWTAADGSVPTFDLAALGLGAVDLTGTESALETDTTAIRAALDKGAAKFVIPTPIGELTIIMTAVQAGADNDKVYFCEYVLLLDDIRQIVIYVDAIGISVCIVPYETILKSYMDAYMEEALGGEY